ncbi:MAG: RNA polymerase factor sigma-54 [Thermoflavifilum sp.]|nr:RNA polymerase factor sigma-54 [Thermoflavifilum sp.]MCL6514724.1 RNA polymerase factor sigma-54 [Alicyclobacillus sp.]
MELELGLLQVQSQRLVMTAQMRQAIAVLQCSAWELYELLQREAEANPYVEVEPPPLPAVAWLRWRDTAGAERGGERREPYPLEQRVSMPVRLADDLEAQLRCMAAPRGVMECAIKLIGMLDENGYLRESSRDIARWLGCSEEEAEAAIRLLQSCDPLGIAARNLRECLLLQMAQVPPPVRDLAQHIVEHHLEHLASEPLTKLARRLGKSPDAVQSAVDAIRRLNPRPAAALGSTSEPPAYVIPDLVLERDGDTLWLRTNEPAEPRLRIRAELWIQAQDDQAASTWLAQRWRRAQWLARCVEQRRWTLYRVAEYIVQWQRRFFDEGWPALRPLTLRQVASALGLHESTVSRAIRGKWMQTPRGVIELRVLFSGEVAADTEEASAALVKHRIRSWIESEDPRHPLSDEALARRLAEEGIRVARRTVTKYREAMRIPSSQRRRRLG